MTAVIPKADIDRERGNVRFVPLGDIAQLIEMKEAAN